mmetsp:Transcript_44898/g.127151  ORF Transcript_44898/g.127151 Transcript_44898/m.127151 type:complete len:450 (+) Transcript_44898:113-1462(+)
MERQRGVWHLSLWFCWSAACLRAAAGLDIGEEVFALDILSYSTDSGPVVIPAVGLGTVQKNNSDLTVLWTDGGKAGVVAGNLVERKACLTTCAALSAFLPAASEALRNGSMMEVDRCMAMQRHYQAAACAMASAQESQCPSAFSRMKQFSDVCTDIGVDIASAPGDIALRFQRIFALTPIRYNTSAGSGIVHVAVGSRGRIIRRAASIVVLWDEPAGLVGNVAEAQVDNATCLESCAGLMDYLLAGVSAVPDTALTQAELCLALQAHANASACGLKEENRAMCPGVWSLLKERAGSCPTIGVDLTKEIPPTDYEHVPCTYCSSDLGRACRNHRCSGHDRDGVRHLPLHSSECVRGVVRHEFNVRGHRLQHHQEWLSHVELVPLERAELLLGPLREAGPTTTALPTINTTTTTDAKAGVVSVSSAPMRRLPAALTAAVALMVINMHILLA